MRVSKAGGPIVLAAFLVSTIAGGAAAQCRYCDPFFHCVQSRYGGALVCLENPLSCAMLMPCLGPGSRMDDATEFLTTWTLYDGTVPQAAHFVRPAPRGLLLGDEARGPASAPPLAGPIADATVAHGSDYAIVLEDAFGDGFALRRAAAGAGVRIEVRDVRAHAVGALLASEVLGEREQLVVPVRVAGSDRLLALQAATVQAVAAPAELARLRQTLAGLARTLPPRAEPLLKAREQ